MMKHISLASVFFCVSLQAFTPWFLQQKNRSVSGFAQHCVQKKRLKYLHIGFHKGCLLEVERVAKELDIDVTSWFIFAKSLEDFEGQDDGLYVYNITRDRAERVWEKHKDYINRFDAIITSDTAPLSRIFLQDEHWKKPLIIWVCNRFDNFFSPTHKPLDFPDDEYYELFRKAAQKENVFIVSYTPYEWYYALTKNVGIGLRTIKPIGVVEELARYNNSQWSVPADVDKPNTIFLYPRLDDQQLNYISNKCTEVGISFYTGRYNGTNDIADFKGVMYWPYQWSNLCLFEDFQRGLVHFVPSISFVKKLEQEGAPIHPVMKGMLREKNFEINEWYCKEHKNLIVYYDSWQDLKHKIDTTDYPAMRKKIITFAQKHKQDMMQGWKEVFEEVESL